MYTPNPWRREFLALVKALHLAHDQAPPHIPDSPREALTIEFRVAGAPFSILHCDPDDSVGRMLVQCTFGKVPQARAGQIFCEALATNQALALRQAGMFAFDMHSHDLVFSFAHSLDGSPVEELLEALLRVAETASDWRRRHAVVMH